MSPIGSPPGSEPGRASRLAHQDGQVVPVIAVALVLAAALGLGLVHLAAVAARQAATQAAADAVALAAASGGEADARRVADANEARIVVIDLGPGEAQVTVEKGRHRATARARRLHAELHQRPSSGPRAAHPVDCHPCLIAPVSPVPM